MAGLGLVACGDPKVDLQATGPDADRDRVFEMASEGDPTAQTSLGLIHERGLGVEKDPVEAMKWYRRAAADGDALAAFHIGSLYERGHGVEQDFDAAASWYARAADGGNEAALTALAYLYERGLGVTRDFQEAEALYGAAERSRDANAELTAATPEVPFGREQPDANLPPTSVPDPALDGPAEFAVGQEEEAAIEIDLGALDDVDDRTAPVADFDGPVPIAGRGEKFPLKDSGPLLSPEQVPAGGKAQARVDLPRIVSPQPAPPRPDMLADIPPGEPVELYPPKTPIPALDRPLTTGE